MWRHGDGASISLWNDVWIPSVGLLGEWASRPLNIVEANLRLYDIVNEHGGWDFGRIEQLIPFTIISSILSLIPPTRDRGADMIAWKGGSDDEFSNGATFEALLNPDLNEESNLLKLVWSWRGAERIHYHLWKMSQKAFLTNFDRWRKGLDPNGLCPICASSEETIMHLFRDCQFVMHVWDRVTVGSCTTGFLVDDLLSWMHLNLSSKESRHDVSWQLIFGVSTHVLWSIQNEKSVS